MRRTAYLYVYSCTPELMGYIDGILVGDGRDYFWETDNIFSCRQDEIYDIHELLLDHNIETMPVKRRQ